ncbi:tetratricopeptide repeat protein [Actinomyces sp. oral taxon 448]|jgi:thioredoxin domain protein (fragment)|uniref:tetratricopeptide repeat protein n=1 Tax=Actinomyces sp. oral taxon 448 TaxID=712124 RepID=UPI0002189DB3|nr:tetratricopeptide repeat protein [Actinomyces sp. oral taxon 448]EGQ73043.1 thioredoxin domain protein [Actinomyces sp. oral taxon 448 str. F0400]
MSMFGAVDLSTLAPRKDAAAGGASGSGTGAGETAASGSAAGSVVSAPLVVDVDAASLRDVAELSTRVPVVVVLHTSRSQASTELAGQLETLAREYAGRFELARVDVDAAAEVAQALQAAAVPTVIALIAGQPVPLFQGSVPVDQLRQLLDQVLELAARNGVSGRLASEVESEPDEPEEETEVERQAREAMERGDYAAAEEVYDHAIAQSPADADLKAARNQIRMLGRMDGEDPRALLAAADAPDASVEEQVAGADAALALGDVNAALGRGLEAVRSHAGEERETARMRLLELFDVIGSSTPEVARARRQLAALLF